MEHDFTVNDHFSVETRHAGRERRPVLIVDDYLRDPEAMVRYAVNQGRFQQSPTMYPGVVAPVPDAYVDGMVRVLLPLLGETFGVQVDTAYLVDSFFAIVTFPAEQLHFRQRLPHVDDYHPGQIAILHYLCDSTQGGTALYRHRATGYESLTKEQNQHMQSLITQDLAAQGPLAPQYVSAGTRLFEQTASFEAKFNRLLIYSGNILHSMLVSPKSNLSPDPRSGRLTTNTFLRFELT